MFHGHFRTIAIFLEIDITVVSALACPPKMIVRIYRRLLVLAGVRYDPVVAAACTGKILHM